MAGRQGAQTSAKATHAGPAVLLRRWPRGTGPLAIVVGFALVVAIAGGLLASRERQRLERGGAGFVEAVAEARARQLERWLFERFGDAEVAGRDLIIGGAVPGHASSHRAGFVLARRRLEVIAQTYGYEAALLLDARRKPVMEIGQAIDHATPEVQEALARVAAGGSKSAHLSWSDAAPDAIKLVLVTPVSLEESGDLETVGALIMRIDAGGALVDALGPPPAATRTGVMSLVAREGERRLFITPHLRADAPGGDGSWIATALPTPAQAPERLVALAKQGARVDLDGAVNDQGQPVLATAVPIVGMPWTVVGKVDREELVGLAMRAQWAQVGLVATLLLGVALTAYAFWRRWSDQALRASEERFRATFENMQDGYLLADMKGEILAVNPATVRMLGHAHESELIGKNLAFDVFVVGAAERQAFRSQLLERGTLSGHKATFTRGDGRQLIIESHVRLLRDDNGAPVAMEGVMRDMSAHYEIRNELIRAREAAMSTAALKAQFLANMSHEIRTPLNAIVGLGHLVARAELPANVRDYVGKMQASVHMLLDVVNNVLDFSKIEAGRLSLEAVPFSLDEIFDGVSNVLAVQAAGKGLELVCSIGSDVPLALVGDPTRLGQVLTNLGGNAVKFTSAGEVIIGVERRGQHGDRAELRFYVRDTGVGLAADEAARMMEPFVQADGSTTRRFGGTGLGLAISRQLVELMGGRLEVESAPGLGSTFSFTVSLAAAPAGVAPRPAPALSGRRALVVDDNAAARLVLERHLRDFALEVEVAASGSEALGKLTGADAGGAAFDLVLLDLRMPGMDGREAARRMKAAPLHRQPAIVMMTAFARDEAHVPDAEAARLLIKPITRSALLDAVVDALGPLGNAPVPSTALPDVAPADARALVGARLLVAEDNAVNQQVARELLEAAGAEVVLAASGDRAVALANAPGAQFDAVLMDLQMPIMDGFAAARDLRRNPAHATLPIIAMTAHAFAEEREKCVAAGMNDHVAKPVEPAVLIATVARWLRPAIDQTAGLRRVGNNARLYGQLLARFAEEWGAGGPRLGRLLSGSAEEQAEGRHLLHTLKGAAGTLGLPLVAESAASLERTWAAAQETAGAGAAAAAGNARGLEQLAAALDLACAHIAATVPLAAPPESAGPRAVGVLEDVLTTIAELETLLARRNLRAREAVARLRQASLPEACHAPLERVTGTVARLDYVAAGAALAQLKAALHAAEARP